VDVGDAARQPAPGPPVEMAGRGRREGAGRRRWRRRWRRGGALARRLESGGGWRLGGWRRPERRGGLADEVPEPPLLVRQRPPPARHRAPSLGRSTTKRAGDAILPASSPASSPEPKKMSPRAGPTIAEPVSWATISRRNGAPPTAVSTTTGVWKLWTSRSTARLRPPASGTLAAATGPSAGSSTVASRKKM